MVSQFIPFVKQTTRTKVSELEIGVPYSLLKPKRLSGPLLRAWFVIPTNYCRKRYAHSKLAVIMQTRAIHNHYRSEGISAFSLHPGIIPTNIQSADPTLFGISIRKMIHWLMPGSVTVADGARTTLFCATSPDAAKNSGHFFVPYGKVDHGPGKWTTDDEAVQELWEASNKMLKDCGCWWLGHYIKWWGLWPSSYRGKCDFRTWGWDRKKARDQGGQA